MADSNTKSVSFKFVVDQQAVAQVKGVLAELTREATKFAEAMKSAGGFFGGGNVGAGVAGKSTAQTAASAAAGRPAAGGPVGAAGAAIKDTADKSVSALQKMTSELKRGVLEQKRDLGELGRALDSIVQKFTGISGITGRLGRFAGPSYAGGGMGPAPAGGMSRGGEFLSTQIGGGVGLGGVAGLVGGAALVGEIARRSFLSYRGSERQGMEINAQYGQAFLKPFEAARTGDIRQALAVQSMNEQERGVLRDQTGVMGNLEAGFSHPLDAFGAYLGGAAFGDDRYARYLESQKQNKVNTLIQQKQNQLGYTQEVGDALSGFEESFGARLQASRMLGLSTGTDRMEGGKMIRGYDTFHANLRGAGYDDAQFIGARNALRGQVGRGAGGLAYGSMAAQAAGFSGYEGLQVAGFRAGNKGAAYAMGGPLAGDQQMAINLGQMALGTGFDPGGTTGGLGMLAAAQGAVGMDMGRGISTPNLLARAQEGIKAGQGIFSDSSPLQSGRNLLAAIQANPIGGVYAQTAITQLNYGQVRDIVNGAPLPENLKNLGVTRHMVEEYHKTTSSTAVADYVATGNSPTDMAVNRFRASGQDLTTYLRGHKGERGALGTAMSISHPEMFSAEGGQGFMGLEASTQKLRAGRGPAGGVDKTIQAKLDQEKTMLLDVGNRLNNTMGKFEALWQASSKLAGALTSLSPTAQRAVDSLIKFADATTQATGTLQTMSGNRGGTNKKTAPKEPQKK